jgi:hypothetical protein
VYKKETELDVAEEGGDYARVVNAYTRVGSRGIDQGEKRGRAVAIVVKRQRLIKKEE